MTRYIDGRSQITVHTDKQTQVQVFPDGQPSKY